MKRPSLVLFLCLSAAWLVACEDSIDERLEALKQEREAFRARVAQIADETPRAEIEDLARTYFLIRKIQLQNRQAPEAVVYDAPPLAVSRDYTDLRDMVDNFVAGLIADSDPEYFSERIKPRLPFAFPLEYELAWEEVLLEDGARVPMAETFDPQSAELHAAMERGEIYIHFPEGAEKRLPRTLKGAFRATLPDELLRFDFAAGEVGESREQAGYKVTLVGVEDHHATVEVERSDGAAPALDSDHLFIAAKDRSGAFLDNSGNGTGRPQMVERFGELLAQALEEALAGEAGARERFEKQMEAHQAQEAGVFRKVSYFRGEVEAVEVLLVDPLQARETDRPLALAMQSFREPSEPDLPLRDIATSAVVYDHDLAHLDEGIKPELPREAVAAAVTVRQRPPRNGRPGEVAFDYPEVVSGAFLGTFYRYDQAADVTFFGSDGQPIALPADSKEAFRFTVNRIEYDPGKFPAPPQRVAGVLRLRILPELKRSRLEPGGLPPGIAIEGNRVILSSKALREEALVYARAADGRFLKEIASIDYRYEDGPTKRVHYYYGEPQAVELLEKGRTETVDYAFDVKLD